MLIFQIFIPKKMKRKKKEIKTSELPYIIQALATSGRDQELVIPIQLNKIIIRIPDKYL